MPELPEGRAQERMMIPKGRGLMLSALRVARTLRRQRMPLGEIRAVLTTDDPVVVHRYLELHQERLEEWTADQRRQLAALERSMA